MMDATHRLLVKENGRLYQENRNLTNQNLKLAEKFGAFARTLENLLTEFTAEISTNYELPKTFQINPGYSDDTGSAAFEQHREVSEAEVDEATGLPDPRSSNDCIAEGDCQDKDWQAKLEPGIDEIKMEDQEVPLEINTVYYSAVLNPENEDNKSVDLGENYFILSRDTSDILRAVEPDFTAEPDFIADPLRLIPCDKCEFTAINTKYLKYHKRKVHYEVPSKCEICDKVCATKSNLTVHMKNIHNFSPARPKSTETVHTKIFSENPVNTDLKNPMMNAEPGIHPSKYKCDKCHFRGKNFISLNAHTRLKHTVKRYKCKLCHFSAVSYKFLMKHMTRGEHKEPANSIVKDHHQTSQIV